MYKILLMVSLLVFLPAVSSCAPKNGFTRTPFNAFEAVPFKSLGIQIDLPEQPKDRYKSYLVKIYQSEAYQQSTNSKSVVLRFHPYWSGKFGMEPEYYLIFRIVKANRNAKIIDVYARLKRLGPIKKNESKNNQNDIEEWIGADQYSNREYYIFQKPIELPNNEMVYSSAKLLHRPQTNTEEDVDIIIIRQILNSIKPLPE